MRKNRKDLEGFLKSIKPAEDSGGNGSKPCLESCSSVVTMTSDKELRSVLRRHEKAVQVHPEDDANWFHYGKLLLDIGQNKVAEAALQEAVRRAPDSANYRYHACPVDSTPYDML